MDNRALGVFDSGVGGLTVVKEIMSQLKNEEIIYFGDTMRVPYGNRSVESIRKFSIQISRFLISQDVKALVIACNTMCVTCLDMLQEEFDIPIIGLVEASIKDSIKYAKKSIGLISSPVPAENGTHDRLIRESGKEYDFYALGAPLLVPMIEKGDLRDETSYDTTKKYLDEMIKRKVDTLILACTHYPLIKDNIKAIMGEDVTIVDPAIGAVNELNKFLTANNMLRQDNTIPKHKFYLSGESSSFSLIIKEALGKIYNYELVDIERY